MIEDRLFHVLSILFCVNTYGVMKCISLYKIGEDDIVHQHVLLRHNEIVNSETILMLSSLLYRLLCECPKSKYLLVI